MQLVIQQLHPRLPNETRFWTAYSKSRAVAIAGDVWYRRPLARPRRRPSDFFSPTIERPMRFLFCLFAAMATVPAASAERLTLDRIHADPALSGPGVRNLQVSPDGARVTFLRGRDDNQFQLDLW